MHEQEGHLDERAHTGRPNVLNLAQEANIIERITENPFLTAVSFARGFGVDEGVISALFRRHGLRCRIAATELRLTEEHRINHQSCRLLREFSRMG